MPQAARLTSELLVRKGQAFPTGGFAQAARQLTAPLGAAVLTALDGGRGSRAPHARRFDDDGTEPPSTAARVRVTLRLDNERHRRLKIFAARHNQSRRDVLEAAIDAYLRACGADCACLRGDLERCGHN